MDILKFSIETYDKNMSEFENTIILLDENMTAPLLT